jgi:hypothetical protein
MPQPHRLHVRYASAHLTIVVGCAMLCPVPQVIADVNFSTDAPGFIAKETRHRVTVKQTVRAAATTPQQPPPAPLRRRPTSRLPWPLRSAGWVHAGHHPCGAHELGGVG